jgi:hypothetical protein
MRSWVSASLARVNSAARISEDAPATEAAGKDRLWFIAEGTAGTVGEQFFQ